MFNYSINKTIFSKFDNTLFTLTIRGRRGGNLIQDQLTGVTRLNVVQQSKPLFTPLSELHTNTDRYLYFVFNCKQISDQTKSFKEADTLKKYQFDVKVATLVSME